MVETKRNEISQAGDLQSHRHQRIVLRKKAPTQDQIKHKVALNLAKLKAKQEMDQIQMVIRLSQQEHFRTIKACPRSGMQSRNGLRE